MFPQLKEEICNIGGEDFRAIPIKNSNDGASMNYRIPKMNFGRREVENWGNTECDETKGLEMGKRPPLKIVICANEERRGGETCVESRKWPIIWTMD